MCGSRDWSILGRRLDHRQGLRPRGSGISVAVARCDACGLLFPDPLPVPASLAQHYGTGPEDYWPADYFDLTDDYMADQLSTFRRLWTDAGEPRALDVGAGVGKGLRILERAGFHAEGIEPSPQFRHKAIEDLGIAATALHQVSMEEASFPAESFDLIAIGAVLEHLYDPSDALAKATSWLRPSGLIWVEVPSARWLLSRGLRALYRMQGLDYVINLSPFHSPYHLYEFTPMCFGLNGRRNGYELAERRIHPANTYLRGLADRAITRLMRQTHSGMQLEVWLRKGPSGYGEEAAGYA